MIEDDSYGVAALAIGILVDRGADCSVFDERDHLLKEIGGDRAKGPAASMFADGAAYGKTVDGVHVDATDIFFTREEVARFSITFFF